MADTLFRIATFNLENLDDDADEPPFESRIAPCARSWSGWRPTSSACRRSTPSTR